MRSREAGLPFATRARKRELCLQRYLSRMTRKFLSPTFFKYFLKTTFLHVPCYPDHYEPKIFFRLSSKYFFRTENFLSQKFQTFLETTFVHVSCYPDHYEPKIFSRFSKSATTLRYTILDSRVLPLKSDLGRQASPLQPDLGSGSSAFRGTPR